MPVYDYRCKDCGFEFTETHGFNEKAFDCPDCESENLERLIKDAPTYAKGMLTRAGDGRKASKEELQAKWREETPKLHKKLRDKLGDDAIQGLPKFNDDK